jgi:DNA mismatch endonuclease (patch repair protein)
MPLPYPVPSSNEVTKRMRRNPRSDTGPEIALRSELHARGFRFRKDYALRFADRVIRPDVVFTRPRIAVFVDGCFWHCCPLHGTKPRVNRGYWGPKLDRNVARDRLVNQLLKNEGWFVIRAWEHEAPNDVAQRVAVAIAERRFINGRRGNGGGLRR